MKLKKLKCLIGHDWHFCGQKDYYHDTESQGRVVVGSTVLHVCFRCGEERQDHINWPV